jgi:hypothetical protein
MHIEEARERIDRSIVIRQAHVLLVADTFQGDVVQRQQELEPFGGTVRATRSLAAHNPQGCDCSVKPYAHRYLHTHSRISF